MVVTPEDIINKRFTITKIRPGYDQDEVDDFLDEVAKELRRVLQLNSDLEAQAAMAGAAPAAAAPVIAAPAPIAPPPAIAPEPAGLDETESSSNILQLARRVYAEHVNEGRLERDRLIEEGTKAAAEVLDSAKAQADGMIAELEVQRSAMVRHIQDLQLFEEEYRSSLRDYLESQLKQVTVDKTVFESSGGSNLNIESAAQAGAAATPGAPAPAN